MKTNKPWTRWLFIAEICLLVLAALAMAGCRFGLLTWKMSLMGVGLALTTAFFIGFAALLVVLLSVLRSRRELIVPALLTVALSMLPLVLSLVIGLRGTQVPRIHDITTDVIDPPTFTAAVSERTSADNPIDYPGAEVARQQQEAYPEVAPIQLEMPQGEAHDLCLALVREAGWRILAEDRAGGRIEAVATTRWFGFKDDVVIRIRSQGDSSRIDLRSASRGGVSDLGVNARRITEFLARLQARARD